jgi:hypothetical protein
MRFGQVQGAKSNSDPTHFNRSDRRGLKILPNELNGRSTFSIITNLEHATDGYMKSRVSCSSGLRNQLTDA